MVARISGGQSPLLSRNITAAIGEKSFIRPSNGATKPTGTPMKLGVTGPEGRNYGGRDISTNLPLEGLVLIASGPTSFLLQKMIFMPELDIMKKAYITKNPAQTRKLGELLAKELRSGEIICLTGELGSGKTTFAQGVLRGLGAKGPYTSPTFVILKCYERKIRKSDQSSAFPLLAKARNSSKPSFIQNIYHVDTYRVGPKDILDLGWREIISDKHNVVIVEWAERIKKVIPKKAIWLKFRCLKGDRRRIVINSKFKNQSAK